MILKLLRRISEEGFFRFLLVGVANTVFGTGIMFLFYNLFGFSYWISSASNYIFGGILSYFLNKYFTFRCRQRSLSEAVRFVLCLIICYLLAYSLARPIISSLLDSTVTVALRDNISMLLGMVLYTLLNFFGQRLFVFSRKKDPEAE